MVKFGILLSEWLDLFVVKDLVLYLCVMVRVFSEIMGQLGVETPFLKIVELYAR